MNQENIVAFMLGQSTMDEGRKAHSLNLDRISAYNYQNLYINVAQKLLREYLIPLEKEAKKEAFRKYLESTGVLDALTKVLVALYEQNDKEKPSSAVEFVQQKLGGPTICEYEKLKAEISDLQIKYNELSVTHQKTCKELEELRCSKSEVRKETVDRDIPKGGSWGGI